MSIGQTGQPLSQRNITIHLQVSCRYRRHLLNVQVPANIPQHSLIINYSTQKFTREILSDGVAVAPLRRSRGPRAYAPNSRMAGDAGLRATRHRLKYSRHRCSNKPVGQLILCCSTFLLNFYRHTRIGKRLIPYSLVSDIIEYETVFCTD